jgi:hypothetical protein
MRFYFNLIGPDHAPIIDDEGVDGIDFEEARQGAMKAIAELRQEKAWAADRWDGWQLVIVDDAGTPLLSIPLGTVAGEAGASLACLALAAWVSLARFELAEQLANMHPDALARFAAFV